jgi:glycosyltransferase involved in cell wall biosynthesis
MDFDISVIIPAHHEGRLAHTTMRSVFRALRYANERGVKTEIIVVMDRPDEKTKEYFARYRNSEIKIHKVDFGDPGCSRNYGINMSSSKYIAFLDADDLFGKNWLKAAYDEAEINRDYCVYHPEYVVCFESENFLVRYRGIDDEEFYPGNMIEHNCWISSFLCPRSLFMESPFVNTPCGSGFGYEDWHWYCEIIARGISIKIVPDTCMFYRRKLHGSRLAEDNLNYVVIRQSKLFEPSIFSSMLKKEKIKREQKALNDKKLYPPKNTAPCI